MWGGCGVSVWVWSECGCGCGALPDTGDSQDVAADGSGGSGPKKPSRVTKRLRATRGPDDTHQA